MATYYVDGVSGLDTNAGTSFGAAFQTIAKAATVVAAGDTVRICATGTYTLTSRVTWTVAGSTAAGPITVTGANATGTVDGTLAVITTSTNSVDMFGLNGAHYMVFRFLKMSNTAATRARAFACVTNACAPMWVADSWFIGFTAVLNDGFTFTAISNTAFERCTFDSCTGTGVDASCIGGQAQPTVRNCFCYNCSGDLFGDSGVGSLIILEGVVANGGQRFFHPTGATEFQVTDCSIYGMTSDAITVGSLQGIGINSSNIVGTVTGNCAYGCTGKFLNMPAHGDAQVVCDWNFLGSMSGGFYANVSGGLHDVTLTNNPFVNPSSGNMALNAVSGGGAAVRNAKFPGTFLGNYTVGYADGGAVQHFL